MTVELPFDLREQSFSVRENVPDNLFMVMLFARISCHNIALFCLLYFNVEFRSPSSEADILILLHIPAFAVAST